jgi:hypothetical protein
MDERSGDGVSTSSNQPSNGESAAPRQQLSQPPALLGKEKLAHNAKAVTAVVFGTVVLINVGFLYSAIPAIRGRGAPYVPTSTENAKIMFQQLRRYLPNRTNVESHSRAGSLTQPMGSSFSLKHHSLEALPLSHQNHTSPNSFVFVDLGSGDGRLVLRAAQEGIFTVCIGYELNPLLVWYSRIRQLLVTTTRQVETWWTKARNRRMELHFVPEAVNELRSFKTRIPQVQFVRQDIWTVHLQNVHVVAIYGFGFGPMMSRLRNKLQSELPIGAIVLSNVFAFPVDYRPANEERQWQLLEKSDKGTYIYRLSSAASRHAMDNIDSRSTMGSLGVSASNSASLRGE